MPSSISECYIWSFRGLRCRKRQFSSLFSLTTFTTHSSSVDWCTMMAQTVSAKILFLCCGQVNSVFCIFLMSSMNLMIHLPRLLCICNYFFLLRWHCCRDKLYRSRWQRINCTPSMVEEMFVFLLYECVHLSYNFQSSLCNRVTISCSIHGTDELYSCKLSLRNSSFFVEYAYSLRIARISPNLQI